jgi:hypothetical protein
VALAVSGNLTRIPFARVNSELVSRQITSGRELLSLPAAVNTRKAAGWLARLWKSFVGQ